MNRILLGLGVMTLAGCPGEITCEEGEVLNDETGVCEVEVTGCENSIKTGTEFPEINEGSAYYRTSVEAELQNEDTTAMISLWQGETEVSGTSTVAGKRVVFQPSDSLMPDTTYTAKLSYCAGEPSWDFTTSEVGSSIGTPDDLIGNTYSLDLGSGRFVEPPGVGDLIRQNLETNILIGVMDITSSGDIQMLGAIAEDGSNPPSQAMCSPSIPFPDAGFDQNPYFNIGPETTTMSIESYDVTITDLFVSGAFAPDASYVDGAVLSGSIDTRPLVPLLGDPDASDDAVCEMAMIIGVACEACPSDNQNFCLSLYVDSIAADLVTDLTLQRLHTAAETNPHADSTDVCDLMDGTTQVCAADCATR